MKKFVVCTDSGCDIRADVLKKWNIAAEELCEAHPDSKIIGAHAGPIAIFFIGKER